MTPAVLLAELHRHGVAVELDGGRPRLAWDEGVNPPGSLIDQARQNRDALIALAVARGESAAPWLPTDGPIPEIAQAGLARLAVMDRAGDFSAPRWGEAVSAARYVATGWLARAIDLGWPLLDVFGCHPVKPYAALHVAGLTLCLRPDDRISAVSESSAAIVAPGGTARTFRRSPICGPRILLWELERHE